MICSTLLDRVDILLLATNCGASVKIISQHYGKHLTATMKSDELVKLTIGQGSYRRVSSPCVLTVSEVRAILRPMRYNSPGFPRSSHRCLCCLGNRVVAE